MDGVKGLLSSKTVWGAIVAILAAAGNAAGYIVTDADTAAVVSNIMAVVTAFGGLYAIYGRIKATHKVVPGASTTPPAVNPEAN